MKHTVGSAWLLALCAGLCDDSTPWSHAVSGRAAVGAQEAVVQETFVSRALGLAIDYPRGWTVIDQSPGATFRSPQGAEIRLARLEDPVSEDLAEPLPNVRCSTSTNAHGVAAHVCLDTISRSYSAQFVVTASDASARRFSLTGSRTNFGVFSAMVASVRSVS